MRKLITILFLFISVIVNAATYYIAPSGADGNSGAIGSPWFTLNKAATVVTAGDIVYMRGGTFTYEVQQYWSGVSGSSGNYITIQNYPGESPVITRDVTFDKSAGYFRGMVVQENSDYIYWKGIRMTGMYTSDDVVDNALVVIDSDNSVFELLECDNSVGGMYMQGTSTGNLILNCDFHDNYSDYNDTNGGNSDGLDVAMISNTSATNTVTGCRSFWNGDDGFDTFQNQGTVTFNQCWAWKNGYVPRTSTEAGNGVGFKLHIDGSSFSGTFKRYLNYCVSAYNKWDGYGQEEGDCRMSLLWCDAHENVRNGFIFDYGTDNAHLFENNIAYNNGDNQVVYNVNVSATDNSYGGGGENEGWTNDVSDADFVSVDYTMMEDAREADGSLPDITYLHLVEGSSLIGAGTGGSDRGAFQYVVPPPEGYKPMPFYFFSPN